MSVADGGNLDPRGPAAGAVHGLGWSVGLHQARYEPFAVASPGAAETCKLCGVLINQYDRDAHNRGHG